MAVKRRIPMDKNKLFSMGKYNQFKKGDLYRDPRINKSEPGKDFLVIDNCPEDFSFLNDYLMNKLPNYPSEEYNMFTTGTDKNGESMVGLYWMDQYMDQHKRAIVLCRNGCEEEVLDVVDRCCKEMGNAAGLNNTALPNGKAKLELPDSLKKFGG